jgi:hypothetical protein
MAWSSGAMRLSNELVAWCTAQAVTSNRTISEGACTLPLDKKTSQMEGVVPTGESSARRKRQKGRLLLAGWTVVTVAISQNVRDSESQRHKKRKPTYPPSKETATNLKYEDILHVNTSSVRLPDLCGQSTSFVCALCTPSRLCNFVWTHALHNKGDRVLNVK